jgi:hypothetical protein
MKLEEKLSGYWLSFIRHDNGHAAVELLLLRKALALSFASPESPILPVGQPAYSNLRASIGRRREAFQAG